jgi:hypothetical protein
MEVNLRYKYLEVTMFVNLSKVPSSDWPEAQLAAAKALSEDGVVVDVKPCADPIDTVVEMARRGKTHVVLLDSSVFDGHARVFELIKIRRVKAKWCPGTSITVNAKGVVSVVEKLNFVQFVDA